MVHASSWDRTKAFYLQVWGHNVKKISAKFAMSLYNMTTITEVNFLIDVCQADLQLEKLLLKKWRFAICGHKITEKIDCEA